MKSVLDSLSQHAPQILLALLIAAAVLCAVLWRLAVSVRETRIRIRSLLEGARGENLERLLFDHLRERVELESRLLSAETRITELERRVATSKRHLGIVRYDAFEDVGGSQSFAMALFDDEGNGAVLTSLVGREDCRVYGKALADGASDRSLSQEEARAIEIAKSSARGPAVTP